MKPLLLFLSVFLTTALFGQNVYIPDATFKTILLSDFHGIDTNDDEEIQVSEAIAFDGTIICGSNGISDLTGIEAFTALTGLVCSFNELTSLDFSQNTALTTLDCHANQLTSLDISQNTALTELSCFNNQLTSLDFSQNTALTTLDCHANQLTSLDISQNTALTDLICDNNELISLDVSQNTALEQLDCTINQLTSLDVSQNTALTGLWCYSNQLTCLKVPISQQQLFFDGFNANNNPNLTCIEVNNVTWANNYHDMWLDPQMYFSEDCNNDCSNNSSLTELTTSKNLIQILDIMGRETTFKPNTPLIYVYDDGSTEKVFTIE